ncbi:MAG: conserved rane protein of unknown function [Bacteroidetes bacterium]|jgi:hypothetical protein|nr:conserved rane protein of unknown function [Bacteroidota bacterium]MDF2453397.1 conserved rane protein of unknown function [Bacteroidota bacterium]
MKKFKTLIVFLPMIQRKQTLFLLAVAIIAIILFFLPFQKLTTPENSWPICLMSGCSAGKITSNIYFPMVLNIIVLILSIATIFLYKNRVFQFKLSNLLVLFNLMILGLFFLLDFTIIEQGSSITYQAGAFIPVISIIFAYLASHFIKKDEQMVRNADRIR